MPLIGWFPLLASLFYFPVIPCTSLIYYWLLHFVWESAYGRTQTKVSKHNFSLLKVLCNCFSICLFFPLLFYLFFMVPVPSFILLFKLYQFTPSVCFWAHVQQGLYSLWWETRVSGLWASLKSANPRVFSDLVPIFLAWDSCIIWVLWTECLYTPKFLCWNSQSSKVMIFGSGAFWRWLTRLWGWSHDEGH